MLLQASKKSALYGKLFDQSHIPSAIESNVPADVDMERWLRGDVDDVIDPFLDFG